MSSAQPRPHSESDPAPAPSTKPAETLSALIAAVSESHAEFLYSAEAVASRHGLTPARWQVIAAAAAEPATVSSIAASLGLARQSVQRVADDVVQLGHATLEPNPHHARAKLLTATVQGRELIAAAQTDQAAWAARLAEVLDTKDAQITFETLTRIVEASHAHWDG